MPRIYVYYRDIGVQMPDFSIYTLKCELRDYYSDVEIMSEFGKIFRLRTLGGLISKLQASGDHFSATSGDHFSAAQSKSVFLDLIQNASLFAPNEAIFIKVEVVKGGHVVDYKWNEFLG